jgi:hypothetical protein
MTTTMERLARGIAQEGWDGFDVFDASSAEAVARQQAKRVAEARDIAGPLAGEAGDRFLVWLAQVTLLRTPNDMERVAQSAEAYALAKAKREGQNDIFFIIADVIRTARGEGQQQGADT